MHESALILSIKHLKVRGKDNRGREQKARLVRAETNDKSL